MSVLHGYNEGLFLWPVSRQIRQTFLFLGKVFRFRWSELLIYNERTFSQPRHRGKEPYMMGSLFRQILPSVATRNPT